MMKSRKKKICILLLSALTVLVCGVVVFFAWRQDIAYRLKTNVQSVFAPSFAPQEAQTETIDMTLEELQRDSRVTFDQSMLLINEQFPLDDSFVPEVGTYRDTDVVFQFCAHGAYRALTEQIEKQFEQKLLIRSAYRSASEQQEELHANSDVATTVGASEHQAGLALDVYIPYYAGYAFLKTDVGRYVNDQCHLYGFIIRYPSYGEDSTGIPYEPWHLRYVGIPHASIMTEHCLTLEEYMESLAGGKLYVYDSYIITRQSGDSFVVPKSFRAAKVSPDHTGGYILTFYI